ncbi:MAG: hypothetical protein HC874_30455 [Richelia sp. SL_2_1]|nr:hypothetical protein [Richelia sp. SL_2_1]
MANELALAVRSNELGLTLKDMKELATVFVASGRFANDKDVAQAMVKIQAGAEIGLKPFESMANIYFVNGIRAFSYPLVASKINASGRYKYRVLENDNSHCVLVFSEKMDDGSWEEIGKSTFSEEDANVGWIVRKR